MDVDKPSPKGEPGTCRPFVASLPPEPLNDGGAGKDVRNLPPEDTNMLETPPGSGENCIFYDPETQSTYEGMCPVSVTNVCSSRSTRDYCLCNNY
jgi:hypothetical protein